MTGWIIANTFSGPGDDCGIILGSDALTYRYRFSDQPEEFTGLILKTSVSFTVVTGPDNEKLALIRSIQTECSDPEILRLDQAVSSALSPKRSMHSFRVSKIARALAERFGCSPEKAEIAGLLHDIAKENSMEDNARIVTDGGCKMASFELRNHAILHAAAGSVTALSEYGINDPEILNAIRYHNGRPAMKKLEKILFLADHIDYGFKNGLFDSNPIAAETDLDRATFMVFMRINLSLAGKRIQADAITESAMNYMLVNRDRDPLPAESPAKDPSPVPDELFDRMVEVNSRRRLNIHSVKNIRELGGYGTAGNRLVRHGMLVRSGRLNMLSIEDAEYLSEFGVHTVIDLRNDDEVTAAPDRNTEGFRVIRCPLTSVDMTEYQKNIFEKYMITSPGKEKTYYLSELLSCISMKEMYMNILTGEANQNSLRKVFDVLCEPDCGGILFHCTSGKDRTGIVAALTLLALGADKETIREDYYVSVLAGFAETEAMAQNLRRQHYPAAYIDEMRYFNGIGMNIGEKVWESITDRYESPEKYLTDVLLLTEDRIRFLRERFTVENPAPQAD